MIKLISYGYFDLIMLIAFMDLINKMDKVNIRASIKTTLLIPPTDTLFVAGLLVFSCLYILIKSRVPILAKVSIFGCILDLKPQILPQKFSNRF